MRFIEIPALITEDIEDPSIVDITEPITVSISGTTMTIDGGSKVSGEATVNLTGDTTINAFTLQNIKHPSLHKISVKTNNKGNFTYVPTDTVTASSVSTTTKTGSDFEILLITTNGGETYADFDMADYTSPALYTSNALTGFDISELTSTYGATAKLYKPDGTLLTTVNSATTGGGVNFGYTESIPGEVTYTLEVEDDLGRKSKYDLPRKWISYAMETNSTPGFEKLALAGNEYTSTTIVPNISTSSKVRVHKKNNHGYLGINFKIQGRNTTNGSWVDIDDTGENENDDESKEYLAFGDYLYHRVWVKPTAKATTDVSSSNVVTLTLTDFTEENLEKSFENFDPFDIDETSNTYVFEETSKVGTIPFTLAIGDQTYSNAFTVTTIDLSIPAEPNTDFTASGPNMLHLVGTSSQPSNYMAEASGDGKYIAFGIDGSGNFKIMKGDPETGYTDYATATFSGASQVFGSMSYDGKYIIVASWGTATDYEIFKHDESTGTYTKLPTTYPRVSTNDPYTHKPAFVPRSGNYDFALTGTDNNATCYIKLYKHNAGTDTWTEQTRIQDPTGRPNGDRYRGQFSKSFTRDGKYLMFGTYSTYGGYEMYTIDWDANTAVFSGANWVQNNNIGHSGAVTPDGKYALLFHNDSNSRKIFKNNDAGDWSSATDVTSEFTFNNGDDDQGGGICFFGEHGQYYISRMGGSNVRIYKWLDVTQKSVSLTYNDKDRITITKTGGLTTTTDKLYKDGVLYETLNSESMIFISETGVYQVISDDKYYSNKITVTTISETEARLYINHATTFLLKRDGKVWYWGEYHRGSNAMGNGTEVSLPTLNDNLNALPGGIKQIGNSGVDPHAMCAITNNGKLYTWGYNGHGQLGRNNTSDYTSQAPWLVDTQSSNTFTFCHCSYYSNFALQDNGYLWSCGYNGQYLLGTGNNSQQNRFYRINLPNVIDFHANHNLAVAVTSSNEVYIWGTEANSCMAGIGTTGTPTRLTALDGKNIVKVRTGGYSGHAISSDGKLYSWGKGQYHAIPDGTNSNVGTPTEMTWFSRKNIRLVDAQFPYDEAAACLALDDQGNMYVWGMSDHGAIGVYHHHPTTHSWPVLLKTNIASISVGRHSCGCIDKFGQVYTWGDGDRGVQNWIHGSNSDTDINYPTSNNLSTGTTLIYDGYDTLKLGKKSSVTSTMLYGSNTLSLDTKSDIFITDPHTYTFKVSDTSSGTLTYLSNVVSTVSRPTGRVYPPKSGIHKNLTTSGSVNVDNTWTVDGALYGNGDYKASMNKNSNSSEHIYHAFSGVTGYGHMHTTNSTDVAIQLHMPQKIKLTKYAMYSRNFTGEYNYAPKTWKVYGSNDNGTNWTELDSQTDETVSSWGSQTDHRDTKREYTVTGNNKYFSSYKLDVTANGGGNFVVISQIEYYGDEDEDFITYDGFGKVTVETKGDTGATSNITYYSNTYEIGTARDLYITDTGDYTVDIYGSTKAFLGTHTVSADTIDNVPGFTLAFHHGTFADSGDPYSDGSVTTAATNGHVFSDTATGTYTWGTLDSVTLTASTGGITDYVVGKTEYTYTPAFSFTGKLLMVAGGGGGGGTIAGGGGGGGLLYNETASFTSSQKTIIVGDGGIGGGNIDQGTNNAGKRGHDTSVSGFTTVIGGGAGGGYSANDADTPSYGGSGGGYKTTYTDYSATTGQGNQGGEITGYAGGGGGGAGEVGADSGNAYSGAGGDGLNYSSVFGTTYGESGWFSGGGGGGGRNDNNAGNAGPSSGGLGGGGNGDHNGNTTISLSSAMNGQLHTGGGGGGGGWNGSKPSGSIGGKGGSGIVLIKKLGPVNPPTLNFDGYNKLTIDNVDLRGYVEGPTDNDKLPRASAAEREIAAGNWTPHYDYIYEAQSSPTGFYRFKICNQSASTPANPTSDTSNTHTNNRHSILYEISTGKWHDGSPNADPNYITTTSTYAAESVTTANPAQIWTWNGTTLNDSYVLSSLSWSQPPPDGSSKFTIKKDGAAFATTTSNTVYIRDTGTYTAEVKGLGAYAIELSREVTGSISSPTLAQTSLTLTNASKNLPTLTNTYALSGSSNEYTWRLGHANVNNNVYVCYATHPSNHGGTGSSVYIRNIHTNETYTLSGTYTIYARGPYSFFAHLNGNEFIIMFLTGSTDDGIIVKRMTLSSTNSWTESSSTTHSIPNSSIDEYWVYQCKPQIRQRNGFTEIIKSYLYNTNQHNLSYRTYRFDFVLIKYTHSTSSFSIENVTAKTGIYFNNEATNARDVNSLFMVPDSNQYVMMYGYTNSGSKNDDANAYGRLAKFTYDYGDGTVSNYLEVGTTGSGRNAPGNRKYRSLIPLYDSSGNINEVLLWNSAHTQNVTQKVTLSNLSHSTVSYDGNLNVYSTGTNTYDHMINVDNIGNYYFISYFTDDQKIGLAILDSKATQPTYEYYETSYTYGGSTDARKYSGHNSFIVLNSDGGSVDWYILMHWSERSYAIERYNIPLVQNIGVQYDNYNKITLNQLNYEDTAEVTYYSNTYNLGTAKTVYVKDTGEYVFKISGTDKYVESNVYVSSVDLAGAPTKPIDFDGYNKLTLIGAGSNVSANVTYFSNTYELGSAKEFYIRDVGTYDLEMSGSNVFALSSNVVGSVIQNVYFSDSWDWTSSSSLTSTDGNTTLTSSGSPTYDISNGYYSFDTAGEYFTLSKNSISSQLALNVNDMVIDFEMYNAEGPSVNYFVFGGNSNARRFYTYNGNNIQTIRNGYNAEQTQLNASYLDWARHTIWFVADTLTFKYYMDGTLKYTYTSTNAGDFHMRDFPFHFGFYSIESGSGSAETRLRKFHYELSNGRITESLIANPDWYGLKPIPSLTFDGYNKLTLENFTTTDIEWPPADGTRSSVTRTNSNKTATWTISGASYGNGEYTAETDDDVWSQNGNHLGYPDMAFNKSLTLPTTSSGFITNNSPQPVELRITLPNAIVLGSYKLQGRALNDTSETPGTWTMEGSNDGTTWTVIDTQTAANPALDNSKTATYTVYGNSTAYNRYKLNISETNVFNGGATVLGELYLYEKNTRTAKLTDPNDVEYTLGQTQNDIYIEDTGEYILEVTNSDQSAVVKTNVGSVSIPDPNQVPLTVTGLSGWYTGSSFNTSTNQWEDISGNDRHMTETQGTMNVNSTGINQKAYVYASRYDGIRIPVTAHSITHTPNYTFFFVGKWTADDNIRGRILDSINNSPGYFSGWYGRQYSGHSRYISPKNGAKDKTTNDTNITGDDWALVTDFNYGFRINGIDRANNSTVSEGGFPQMSINYGLYNTGTYRQNYEYSEGCSWAGAELICYNRTLTANEISLIEGYLQSKYLISNDIQQVLIPSLTYDTYNKLSIENLTPTSTTLTDPNGSSFDIGTASNVYIEHAGTYKMATGDATTFALVSKQVNTLAPKPDYTNIWAGEIAGMVIDSDGKLYTWGSDNSNESGRGASDRTPTHISTISDPVSNVWVDGAPGRTRIVKTSTNKWYMWGMNGSHSKIFGQTVNQTTPVDVTSYFTTYFGAQGASDSTRIVKVVMSANACSALAADGKVWSWGKDESRNELGNNTNTTTATPFKNTTDGTAELTDIVDICSLHYGKLALDSNGDVWQWGQLRTGSTGYATKQTDLDSVTIIGIGTGFFTAYAWDATGTIYSTGQGTEGQLGNGADSDQDSTWQTITTLQGKTIYGIYGAGYSVFAHTSDGVYACGQGANGRLGMGNSDNLNVFTKSVALSALSIYKLDFGHGPGYIITTDGKGYALGRDAINSIPTPLSGDKNVPTEASSLTNLSLVPPPPPSLTYDTSNKLSIENLTPTSTTLTDPNGTSFDIGTATDVYIRDSGKYSIVSKDANTFLLASNTVTGTPTGTYDKRVPLAFHHGTFADSGDPHGDGSSNYS
jgi:alpha-tubulin suppressor-like RCC1 family protein